jgi:hypothetical protein
VRALVRAIRAKIRARILLICRLFTILINKS